MNQYASQRLMIVVSESEFICAHPMVTDEVPHWFVIPVTRFTPAAGVD